MFITVCREMMMREMMMMLITILARDPKLEGETENVGVCTKEWEGDDSRGTHSHSLHKVIGM